MAGYVIESGGEMGQWETNNDKPTAPLLSLENNFDFEREKLYHQSPVHQQTQLLQVQVQHEHDQKRQQQLREQPQYWNA